jgi:hypothetical protein
MPDGRSGWVAGEGRGPVPTSAPIDCGGSAVLHDLRQSIRFESGALSFQLDLLGHRRGHRCALGYLRIPSRRPA